MYALVRLTRQSTNGWHRHVIYGICSNRRLLEKIRAGQEHPEEWRVTDIGLSGFYKSAASRRKAG